MGKKYTTIKSLIVLACTLAFNAGAQLSGVYTINSAVITGGTNYQSFNDFATDINTNGVSGPVTVNVAPGSGPYVEQVQFMQIAGASSINRIVINGNGNLITFNSTSSAQPWTIALNGTDYFGLSDLNVQGTGPTYALVLKLWNDANYNTFSACNFSVNPNVTGTGCVPISISGSGTSYSSNGPSGEYNLIENCTTFSGYVGIGIYGNSSSFAKGNRVIGCLIQDFYYSGVWSYSYTDGTIIRKNIMECPTRTNSTTKSGVYSYYNQNVIIEENWVRNLFNAGLQSNTSTSYGIYCAYNLDSYTYGYSYPSRYPNRVRNNIISDITNNGTQYGIYFYYADGEVYNNTISLDFGPSTSGSTTYGIYSYGTTQYNSDVTNNIVTIRRGGSGTKYCWYAAGGSNAGNTGDRNNLYINAPAGTNYVGYYTGAATTQMIFSGQGVNTSGTSVDPVYVSIPLQDYHPTDVTINNSASVKGLIFDQKGAVRNSNTPDIGALEFLTPLCSGAPALSSIAGPTFAICPGENISMMVGNLIPDAGIEYMWRYSSSSQVGPFTTTLSPAGPTNLFYSENNVTSPGWYQVVATCTNSGGSQTNVVLPLLISGPTASTVPAYENFEGIGLEGRLPNCSWSSSGAVQTYVTSGTGNRVPLSGVSFGTFNNSTPGTSYYFTNPIQMEPSITYSAAVHYATEYFGYTNWTDLSILVGPNQSTVGMVQVASVSPALSGPYKLLDGLFTVPSSGQYYVAIRATGATGSAQYLMIDDLSITIPCDAMSPNTPTLSSTASAATVCIGDIVSINASGADTYSWPGSNTGSTYTFMPSQIGINDIVVVGTNTITGCPSSNTTQIWANPSPNVWVIANEPIVCAGKEVYLTAFGADQYSWSNGSITSTTSVSPPSNTVVTCFGVNSAGCSGTYAYSITVLTTPVVSAISSALGEACKDDVITLTASSPGALTYLWISSASSQVYQGSSINITSPATAVFTVTAKDANGCEGTTTIVQSISECVGIAKNTGLNNLAVFPNPTSGLVNIEFTVAGEKSISVTDVTGRVIITQNVTEANAQIDISNLSNGIYYFNINANEGSTVLKVVKQ